MKRCNDCEYWEAPEMGEWGSCKLADSENGDPTHEESMAVAVDFEGYRASLSTHKNFGCVQWEKKV